MFLGRWNITGARIFYLGIAIIGLILILHSGKDGIDRTPAAFNNILEYVKPAPTEPPHNHAEAVNAFLDLRRDSNFSNLGRILFMNEKRPPPRDKVFKILMYYKGEAMEARHLYFFGPDRHEPFEFCEVKNCELSYKDEDFSTADAVIFHFHTFNEDYHPPTNFTRPPGQRWVFTSDESPHYTFMLQPNVWWNYSGVFNWSMMYRIESDAPVAYGRIVPLEKPIEVPPNAGFQEKYELLVPNAKEKQRDVLVAIMSSNCFANNRMQYIVELQKYIKIDIYGSCGSKHLREICPWKGYGHECQELKKYLFYLSFHNSNCRGYMTEKLYTHALKHGSVPIYMGMYQNQSDLLAPPNSYIHIDNFKTPEELAKFIHHINDTLEENYMKYHEWRRDFECLNEDGYMGSKSYHYCRLCEALNYNDESPRVYYKDDLAFFLDPDLNCHNPDW